MVLLEKYNGSVDRCRGFLRQCEIFFSHQPDMYREEGTKCAFMFLLLTGRALDWASTVWDMDPQIRTCFMCFTGMVCEVFENPAGEYPDIRFTNALTGHPLLRDLREVFSKEKATSLPEHRPWDCAIDLFPNTTPPNSRVYPLSLLETNAMDEYIEEALAMGHIRPSTSPVVAVFLHGEKGKRMRVNVPALITEDSKPSPSITPIRSRWYRQH
ncbi:hypothetical protein QTP70_010917 [Hemibagrus guttatus]|uniref:DUF4939 domain-containing protein n=1 Tax=Hemibagrus guttatus TaxID=175788 RepID=A0AAE0UWV7_9TELE|nr:hypothetical protein QTP70_010917 [Hemibagrus guttatus]